MLFEFLHVTFDLDRYYQADKHQREEFVSLSALIYDQRLCPNLSESLMEEIAELILDNGQLHPTTV